MTPLKLTQLGGAEKCDKFKKNLDKSVITKEKQTTVMRPLFIATIISLIFFYANAQKELTSTTEIDDGPEVTSESPQYETSTQSTHPPTTQGVAAVSISLFVLVFAFILTLINL